MRGARTDTSIHTDPPVLPKPYTPTRDTLIHGGLQRVYCLPITPPGRTSMTTMAGGQAGAGRRSRSRGICGGMAPALRRLAERAPWRSVGQSEGNQPVGRSPVQKACPLRGFPPDKREGHRGIRLPAMGSLRWFMRPHIQMKSRGRIPRRLRPLRGRLGSKGGERKPPVEASEARRP